MKRTLSIFFIVIVSGAIGFAIAEFVPFSDTDSEEGSTGSGAKEILYWVAPMDPNFRRDKPGKSPMGMDLVPVYAGEGPTEEDLVSIDPTVVQNLGVRSETVQKGVLNRTIRTVGYVEYDENALHHIHTRVDGWIDKLFVKSEGDPIEEGQVLFELYSPTLVNAQQEYLMAKEQRNLTLKEASADRLSALGMTAAEVATLDETESVNQRIRIFARSDGVIGMLGVREGEFVTPSKHALSIAELDRVWIVAEVLERQSGLVELGQVVQFELDSMPGKKWNGEVEYIYPELDAKTRSLKVRVSFNSGGEVLRPNMFANVFISVRGEEEVIHIPKNALIRGGLADRVVLELGDGKFRSVPVATGMETETRIEVTRGLEVGQRVVISGQFLIDSESNIEEALARFESAKNEESNVAQVDAIIRRLNEDDSTIRVKHGPIPKWGWRSMTMNLRVRDTGLFEGLESGTEVLLDIEKMDTGKYQVVAINPKVN
ncbi:MAG: efflux RND transporter periplasmic adaptor subunit [Gammaproteobacteria bacterium]|nr:efflux RND transporter periplasmic adaptor subunit [Gammaproteobacteria bacterium]